MLDIKDNLVFELKKFCKSSFNLDEIISSASELKYTKEIKNIMLSEFANPTENFVKFFAAQIHTGRLTQNVIEKYTEVTKRALNQFINDLINERLKSAIVSDTVNQETEPTQDLNTGETKNDDKDQINTTIEELEGFATVKSILRSTIELKRLTYKDTLSYCNILLDNNVRKPICRLYFNSKQKYISLFDENKKENKFPIDSIDDIFNYSDQIIETVNKLENKEKSIK